MAPNGTDDFREPVPPPNGDIPRLPPRPKRNVIVGLGALVAAITAIYIAQQFRVLCFDLFISAKCRTIDAYKVVNKGGGGVAGSFRVSRSMFNSIQSDGYAGACLMMDYTALNLPPIGTANGKCSTDADCRGPILAIAPYNGWESLCHQGEGTCWVRPGLGMPQQSPICNKDPTTPRVDGTMYDSFGGGHQPYNLADLKSSIGGQPILAPGAAARPLKMRVVACLNGAVPTGAQKPCADVNSLNRMRKFSAVDTFTIP